MAKSVRLGGMCSKALKPSHEESRHVVAVLIDNLLDGLTDPVMPELLNMTLEATAIAANLENCLGRDTRDLSKDAQVKLNRATAANVWSTADFQ